MSQASFSTRDGVRIFFKTWGEPASPRRVALIHSLAMDHKFWAPVASRLAAQGAFAVALDCRGHGASDKPAGPYSADLFADDLADLFAHLNWPSAAVAGSSMGGCIALAFAVRHGSMASGLGLIDTTSWYGQDAEKAWAQRANAALEKGLSSLIDFQLGRWFSEDFLAANPDTAQTCVQTLLANEPRAYAEACRMLGAIDMRAHLGELHMPTRIVVGEQDYATPLAMAQVLNENIHGSNLRVLSKARHFTPLEAPDEIVSEIEALLPSRGGK